MKKQPGLFLATLALFLAAGPLSAGAQTRLQAGAGSAVRVVPAIGFEAALAVPSAALTPLPSAAPAAGIPELPAPAVVPMPADAASVPEKAAAVSAPAAASASVELQKYIWTEKILPGAYASLPRTRSRVGALIFRTLLHMGRTFDKASDELPSSRGGYKIFHPFGSVLKVRYDALPGHPFTGLFADRGVPGLMRLSLASPPTDATFAPGAALKLFIDGHSSANAVFLSAPGVDGQQPDKNFFAHPFTNILPEPRSIKLKIAKVVLGLFNRFNAVRIPVDAFARHHADGSPVSEPKVPYHLWLKPARGLGNDSNTANDFRVELARVPAGPLFEVYASATPEGPHVRIGDIHAESAPVASEYGDRNLFFQHQRVAP